MSPGDGLGEVRSGVEGDAEIYEECAPTLMRLAAVLVGPSDAPDVVADAVVRALASPRWRAVSNRPTYLTRAVQNEARRKWRSDARRSRRERRAGLASFTAVPEPADSDPELIAAIRGLSARQQTVVVLTYWEDMTPAAVALRIGISEGAVKRHLARARTNLRKVLDGTG
jgi:RNA polymerase sigma factor (sigma-70 family)